MLTPPTPTSHAPPCLQEPLGAGMGEKTGSRGPPALPHPAQGLATLHLLRGLRLPPAKPASWKGLSVSWGFGPHLAQLGANGKRPQHPRGWRQSGGPVQDPPARRWDLNPLGAHRAPGFQGGLHAGLRNRRAPWPGHPWLGPGALGLNSGSAVSHGPRPSSWPALPGCHVMLEPFPHREGPPLPAGSGAGRDAESHALGRGGPGPGARMGSRSGLSGADPVLPAPSRSGRGRN